MPKTQENQHKYELEDSVRCPNCDKIYDIYENEAYELYDQDEERHELDCPSCSKTFYCDLQIRRSYSTFIGKEDDYE